MHTTSRTMLALVAGVWALVACGESKPPAPPAAPLAAPPEPEKITAENADAADDALEKEIAADAD